MKKQSFEEKLDIYRMKLGRGLTNEELDRFVETFADKGSLDMSYCASDVCPSKNECLRSTRREFGLAGRFYSLSDFYHEGEVCEFFVVIGE